MTPTGLLPVVAQPDRLEGLLRLFARVGDEVDCIVLDDGFQHRRIARQFDVVLSDASRDPFTERCLPSGWLREPVSSLARADAVVLTHAEMVDSSTLLAMRKAVRSLLVTSLRAVGVSLSPEDAKPQFNFNCFVP